MSTLTVPVDDLRRVLAAVECASAQDGGLLSGSQERAYMALSRLLQRAGHTCLHRPVKDCPACRMSAAQDV